MAGFIRFDRLTAPVRLTRLNRVRLRCGSQVCLARLRDGDYSHSTRLRGYVDERAISTVSSFQLTRSARLILAHRSHLNWSGRGGQLGEKAPCRSDHHVCAASVASQHCYWRSHPSSARRGMWRLIWSHPEFPTKEDIPDELRRSDLFPLNTHEKLKNIKSSPSHADTPDVGRIDFRR